VSQHLKKLLFNSQELAPLRSNLESLNELQRYFISVAPKNLSSNCQVLGMRHGILNIAAPNPTIASKLRQMAPELTTLMQTRGCEVSGLRIKVQVSYDVRQPHPGPRNISPAIQKELIEFIRHLDESPLKNILTKLASKKNSE